MVSELIQNSAAWLTSSHSISMPGWGWLLAIPAAGVVIVLITIILIHLAVISCLRSIW